MSQEQQNIQLVSDFIAAVCRNKQDEILSYFTEDARYHNVPMEKPRFGKTEIWEEMSIIHSMATDIDWITHHIGANNEDCVFTERSDKYKVNDQWVTFEVMGIFQIKDGKIAHWRDYFDLKKSTDQLA